MSKQKLRHNTSQKASSSSTFRSPFRQPTPQKKRHSRFLSDLGGPQPQTRLINRPSRVSQEVSRWVRTSEDCIFHFLHRRICKTASRMPTNEKRCEANRFTRALTIPHRIERGRKTISVCRPPSSITRHINLRVAPLLSPAHLPREKRRSFR